ncbi:MAG TPA: hypothetical protein VGN08_01405 [Solirubrobacteraceae bacterium]
MPARPRRRHASTQTTVAALAAVAVVAVLALPAGAGAVTTIKTRTSTTTIYGTPPAGLQSGSTSGPVSPSNVPRTGRIKVPQVGTGLRLPGGTRASTTKAAPPAAAAKPSTGPTAAGTTPAATAPAAKAPAAPAATSPLGATPQTTPARAAAHSSSSLSLGEILLAALAGLLVLACVAWLLARSLAFEPHWSLSARHAVSEASFRASSTWAEFTDWMRLGH